MVLWVNVYIKMYQTVYIKHMLCIIYQLHSNKAVFKNIQSIEKKSKQNIGEKERDLGVKIDLIW